MRAGALLALALIAPSIGAAQDMRSFTVERGRRSESSLHTIIDLAAGTFFLRPSTTDALYRMDLKYDAARYTPVAAFEGDRSQVRLGLEKRKSGGLWVVKRDQLAQSAVVELSPDVALTLEANLGASETSLELGGLRLEDLSLVTGASRTEVRFSRVNPTLCRRAVVTTGAAEFVVKGLGNSGCRRWDIGGGVGAVRLELDGAWNAPARVQLDMTLGGVTLAVPPGLGVRIRLNRFLASFSPDRFSRDGNVYTSDNYATAKRTVDFDISTTLGEVRVEWR